jgi:hypothetical protein
MNDDDDDDAKTLEIQGNVKVAPLPKGHAMEIKIISSLSGVCRIVKCCVKRWQV